jgi:DNA repair photolyase
MRVLPADKKSAPLKRADFGCLRGHEALNLTRGCLHSCVYCYARGYRNAPEKDTVYFYRNLPSDLRRDLDNPRRRRKIPVVAFNTASDCFQPHPDILEITYNSMEILLQRGVSISFLTKGRIPASFMRLFAENPGLVRARMGMVSPFEDYRRRFEPGTASIPERLEAIRELQRAGVSVSVRVDPVIPFCSDDAETVSHLMHVLSKHGVTDISLSYLQLRPGVLERLREELPKTQFHLLSGCFRSGEWHRPDGTAWSKLVPLSLRRKGHERFLEQARRREMNVAICACKNPDLPGDLCDANPDKTQTRRTKTRPPKKKLSLFDC